MIAPLVRAAVTACLVALAPGLAAAGEHGLPVDSPIVAVTFPDDWTIAKRDRSLEASSRNETMVVTYRLVDMRDFSTAMKSWEDWAARQNIRLLEDGKSIRKFQFEGQDSISHRWRAIDRDGPTIVMRTILKLNEAKLLFITEWGAESATQTYARQLQSIRRSVTKLP